MKDEGVFEVKFSKSHAPLLVELDDTRLLSIKGGDCYGQHSEDGGRSWSDEFEFRLKILSVSHLSTGQLGAISSVTANELGFFTSDDEGKTWSKVGSFGQSGGDSLLGYNNLIQLQSGRLLVPVYCFINDYEHPEYKGEGTGHSAKGGYGTYQGRRMLVEGHSHTPEFGWVQVYYSDDMGKDWKKSVNNLWIWPLPSEEYFGGHSPLFEPVEVELEDDHILMFMRSEVGSLYQAESFDGGESWSIPKSTFLASSGSPCKIERIPQSGDLVVIWNQVSADEILRGLKRARICCAVSDDRGKTWKNFKTLDATALPPVGKIEPPPIRSYHSLDDVGEIPVDFGTFGYPDIAFADDTVLFSYSVTEMKPMSEWTEKTPIWGEILSYGKIKGVPIDWLYK